MSTTWSSIPFTGVNWQGLAWDPATQLFHLSEASIGDSYTLDPANGTLTNLGPVGLRKINGIEIAADGTLYGIDWSGGKIMTIDKVTGVGTVIATTKDSAGVTVTRWQSITQAKDGTWYGTTANNETLWTMDMTSGLVTKVGTHGVSGAWYITGMEIYDLTPRFVKGCSDSTGKQTEVTLSGSLALGGTFTIDADSGLPAATTAITMFGLSDTTWLGTNLPFSLTGIGAGPGCMLYQDAVFTFGMMTGTGVALTIPNTPNLVGAVLFAQVALIDAPASNLGIVFTDYVRIDVTQ